jgi:hypothetical protein
LWEKGHNCGKKAQQIDDGVNQQKKREERDQQNKYITNLFLAS